MVKAPNAFVSEQIFSIINEEAKGGNQMQYFKLASYLIEENLLSSSFSSNTIFAQVIDWIKGHHSTESKGSKKRDQTLIGLMKLAVKLIDKAGISKEIIDIADQKGLMAELFNKCLFPDNIEIPTEDITIKTDKSKTSISSNKCKTDESRKQAYMLLWTLCKNSPRLLEQILTHGLVPLCNKIKRQSGWNYTPSGDSKTSRYLGIKNLGCICYMISML